MLKTILAIALSMFPGFAAIQAGMVWDVRTTGSDTNGGGFDASVASPGTNWSVQDAAHQTYTDLVIGGTTTQLTSAAHPFAGTDAGNVINITGGGGGCTTGWYEILSVSGVTATMDRSVGTAANTCNGNEGGGLATIGKANALAVTGNQVYAKTGTYTITTAISIAANLRLRFAGYGATHGDEGSRPTLTTSTNNIDGFDLGQFSGLFLDNFILSSTAGTPGIGIKPTSNPPDMIYVRGSKLSGWLRAYDANNTAPSIESFEDAEVTSCTNTDAAKGALTMAGTIAIYYCWIHDNSGNGACFTANNSARHVLQSVFSGNGAAGLLDRTSPKRSSIVNSVFYSNTGDGYQNNSGADLNLASDILNHLTSWEFANNLAYGNGGFGVDIHGVGWPVIPNRNNAYGGNKSGARSGLPAGTNDVTLSSSPFNNPGSGDFSLNNTGGAGAACRSVGYPDNAFGAGLSTNSYLDVGAARHQDPAGGGGQTGYTFSLLLISLLALGAVVLRRAL